MRSQQATAHCVSGPVDFGLPSGLPRVGKCSLHLPAGPLRLSIPVSHPPLRMRADACDF